MGCSNTSITERREERIYDSKVQTKCVKYRMCKHSDHGVYHFIKIVIVHIKTQPGHILIIITDNL